MTRDKRIGDQQRLIFVRDEDSQHPWIAVLIAVTLICGGLLWAVVSVWEYVLGKLPI